jgi:hypothetical protein
VAKLGCMQQPDGLNGEVNAVIVVVHRHPDGQARHRAETVFPSLR